MKITNNLKTLGFEQSHADPWVLRKVVVEEAEVMAVIHVDDVFVVGKWAENVDLFVADFRSRFKFKDLGKATQHIGCYTS